MTLKDIETNANKARTLDFRGAGPQINSQRETAKTSFIKELKNSPFKITDASLDKADFNFGFELNGKNYVARAFVNQEYLDKGATFRKAQLENFEKVSIRLEKQGLSFEFKLNPPENLSVNKIVEKAINASDGDGGISKSDRNKPSPSSPPSNPNLNRARDLHAALAA